MSASTEIDHVRRCRNAQLSPGGGSARRLRWPTSCPAVFSRPGRITRWVRQPGSSHAGRQGVADAAGVKTATPGWMAGTGIGITGTSRWTLKALAIGVTPSQRRKRKRGAVRVHILIQPSASGILTAPSQPDSLHLAALRRGGAEGAGALSIFTIHCVPGRVKREPGSRKLEEVSIGISFLRFVIPDIACGNSGNAGSTKKRGREVARWRCAASHPTVGLPSGPTRSLRKGSDPLRRRRTRVGV